MHHQQTVKVWFRDFEWVIESSIDFPEIIHSNYRETASDKPTDEQVMKVTKKHLDKTFKEYVQLLKTV
jgi:sulfatase maturation enzyme AslB (radical SAM superfamily)